ncbi:hypothetical protein ACIRYZ_18250 [Kitasatospora sp. NPDC101155]|uniref:hypothetical protein n=1 Tax=Kitasatospora sp. NPDC101155 TaxID=3364097 RepID=UPI00382D9D86
MDGLWALYGMVILGGIAVPLGLAHAERHISAERVRATLDGTDLTPALLGMLAGGPGRVVDAVIADLVERGDLRAEDARLRRPSRRRRSRSRPDCRCAWWTERYWVPSWP